MRSDRGVWMNYAVYTARGMDLCMDMKYKLSTRRHGGHGDSLFRGTKFLLCDLRTNAFPVQRTQRKYGVPPLRSPLPCGEAGERPPCSPCLRVYNLFFYVHAQNHPAQSITSTETGTVTYFCGMGISTCPFYAFTGIHCARHSCTKSCPHNFTCRFPFSNSGAWRRDTFGKLLPYPEIHSMIITTHLQNHSEKLFNRTLFFC
jgi:hypothetical protein